MKNECRRIEYECNSKERKEHDVNDRRERGLDTSYDTKTALGVGTHNQAREKEEDLDSYAACHDISMIPGHKCPSAMRRTLLGCNGDICHKIYGKDHEVHSIGDERKYTIIEVKLVCERRRYLVRSCRSVRVWAPKKHVNYDHIRVSPNTCAWHNTDAQCLLVAVKVAESLSTAHTSTSQTLCKSPAESRAAVSAG